MTFIDANRGIQILRCSAVLKILIIYEHVLCTGMR